MARYQILPIETDKLKFTDINKLLWNFQRETMLISNRIVQLCWEFAGYERDYKRQFDVYPDAENREKVLGYKALNSFIYSEISNEFKKLNTGNLSTSIKNVYDKFKRDKIKYLKGEVSIPSYKSTVPVDLKGSNIFFEYDEAFSRWKVSLSLISNIYKKERGLDSGKLHFNMIIKSGSQKSILEGCIDGIYKICASKLIYKKGKWFLNLSYGFDHESIKPEYDDSLIMGAFLGKFNAVCCAFNNNDLFLRLEGGDVEVYRQKIEARRRSLLKQSMECGDGRIGHGYHTRVKPVETLSSKISDYRNTINHKYSKMIVEFAKKNNCGMIYFEDLSGISENDKFLKNWSYYDLQSKTLYKAKQNGIEVHIVKLKIPEDTYLEDEADRKIAKSLSSTNANDISANV